MNNNIKVEITEYGKKKIEELSDDRVMELLEDKWIVPMTDGLAELPDSIISDFMDRKPLMKKKREEIIAFLYG